VADIALRYICGRRNARGALSCAGKMPASLAQRFASS
jgi:hypothetical protein